MKEIYERFKGPLNKFWLKVRKFAIWLTGIAISIIEINKYVEGIVIPAQLISVCSYIVVGGIVLGLSAQMTKK